MLLFQGIIDSIPLLDKQDKTRQDKTNTYKVAPVYVLEKISKDFTKEDRYIFNEEKDKIIIRIMIHYKLDNS